MGGVVPVGEDQDDHKKHDSNYREYARRGGAYVREPIPATPADGVVSCHRIAAGRTGAK